MHGEPLWPGRAFSFENPVNVATDYADRFPLLLPITETNRPSGDPKYLITPEERFIAQDDVYPGLEGVWIVHSWYDGRRMAFRQLLDQEVVEKLFPEDYHHPLHQRGAIPVTNVSWPEPTPESLMIQVRVLSYWGNQLPRSYFRHNWEPIPWSVCQGLEELPLEESLPRALEMLTEYVDDPAAALRERGFAV